MPSPKLLALTLATTLCALLDTPVTAFELPFIGEVFSGSEAEPKSTTNLPGGREWWRTHKKQAVFVPDQGYQVDGVDGYFDGNGISINASIDEQSVLLGRQDEEGGGLLPGLDPKKAVKRVREVTGYGPDEQVARALLEDGVVLFNQKNYSPAATKFEAASDRWPGTDLAAKALFNLGEAHFFDNEFKEASDAYITLLDKHPSTPKLDATVERLWEIAQYWEKAYFADSWHAPFDFNPTDGTRPNADTVGHAVRLYEAIRLNDPTGPRADDSIMATAGIHFRRQRFADADYHYTLLRDEYPRSDHQFEAHVLGLQAKLQRYHGPDYDGTPLRAAERLEERTRVNFSGRLTDEERTRLRDVRAQVARATEERDLRMVEFYEGQEQIASAKYYLARISEDYSGSPVAEKAEERLATYEGKPDAPDVPMEWMVNLFPENKKYRSIRAIEKIAPAAPPTLDPNAGKTMVADQSKPAAEGGTSTR